LKGLGEKGPHFEGFGWFTEEGFWEFGLRGEDWCGKVWHFQLENPKIWGC